MKQKAKHNANKSLLENVSCPYCNHHKAWSKTSGTFCTRCGKDVNEEIEIKPMRASGTPPKRR